MANTIADKLTYLSGTKDAIKQAIIRKGVEVSDTDTFRSYADKISSIQSGGGGTVNIPDGTKFAYSTFTTVPDSIIPYLETQTDMSYMFNYCKKLTSIQLYDTHRCTTMANMFAYCEKLQTIPLFSTKNCTIMSSMFNNCSSLTSVPLLNMNKVIFLPSMFFGCSSLTNLGGFTGLKLSLNLSESPLLTVESVMNVITAAADMTSKPKTLTLHQDVFNKLSQEQITIANKKGWNIAAA